MTLGIVGISEMQKCGLKYVMWCARKAWTRGKRCRDRCWNLVLGPCGGKGVLSCGTAGGKDGGNVESHNRLNGTPADSEMGA